MERNIKNMKISNKYDRLVRKLIAGESSSEEMEELAHWNVVETKMKKQFDAAKNIVEEGSGIRSTPDARLLLSVVRNFNSDIGGLH